MKAKVSPGKFLAAYVRQVRILRKETREEVARRIGAEGEGQKLISHVERGRGVKLSDIPKLAEALGVHEGILRMVVDNAYSQ